MKKKLIFAVGFLIVSVSYFPISFAGGICMSPAGRFVGNDSLQLTTNANENRHQMIYFDENGNKITVTKEIVDEEAAVEEQNNEQLKLNELQYITNYK